MQLLSSGLLISTMKLILRELNLHEPETQEVKSLMSKCYKVLRN